MGKESLIDRLKRLADIKHLVFKLVCPIYLWSIDMKSLEEYWDVIYEHEKYSHENGLSNPSIQKKEDK